MTEVTLSHSQQQQILDLVARLKQALEARSAELLEPLLGDAPLWLFTHPVTAAQLLEELQRSSAGADDLECFLLDVADLQGSGQGVAIDSRIQLVWTDPESWEEIEWNAMLHLGLTERDQSWRIAYLGFTLPAAGADRRGRPPAALDPPLHAAAGAAALPQEVAYFQASPSDLFAHDEADFDPFTAPGDAAPAPAGDWVPLYLPRSVLAEMLRQAVKDA